MPDPIVIYSKNKHEVGDEIKVGTRTGETVTGTVVAKCENESRYQNLPVTDMSQPNNVRHVNNGKDYYRVNIKK